MKTIVLLLTLLLAQASFSQTKRTKIGIAGMTHDHVNQVFQYFKESSPVEIVGFAEPDKALAMKLLKQHNLSEKLWFPTLEALIAQTHPEAVCAFNSIFEHLQVVETCAPKGIHVMVEKPLAVSPEHANRMEELALKHKIHLLTNYETTWYASNQAAYKMIYEQKMIGDIRKVVIHDGHRGPKEIGCSEAFLHWLTDPIMNGGGAIIDFGCYGANLMSWLQNGERPLSVTAVTQQIKPHIYPNVDDEASIILTYPKAQAIIQASWNWPFDRKDIEIYGQNGFIFGDKTLNLKVQAGDRNSVAHEVKINPLDAPINDAFVYLASVVQGKKISENDLSSLKINKLVVEILDAAKRSAKEKRTIIF
jgi:predicted dehydrogenase